MQKLSLEELFIAGPRNCHTFLHTQTNQSKSNSNSNSNSDSPNKKQLQKNVSLNEMNSQEDTPDILPENNNENDSNDKDKDNEENMTYEIFKIPHIFLFFEPCERKSFYPTFAKHHYKSQSVNPSAYTYRVWGKFMYQTFCKKERQIMENNKKMITNKLKQHKIMSNNNNVSYTQLIAQNNSLNNSQNNDSYMISQLMHHQSNLNNNTHFNDELYHICQSMLNHHQKPVLTDQQLLYESNHIGDKVMFDIYFCFYLNLHGFTIFIYVSVYLLCLCEIESLYAFFFKT